MKVQNSFEKNLFKTKSVRAVGSSNLYICPLRTKIEMTRDCQLGQVPPAQVRYPPKLALD